MPCARPSRSGTERPARSGSRGQSTEARSEGDFPRPETRRRTVAGRELEGLAEERLGHVVPGRWNGLQLGDRVLKRYRDDVVSVQGGHRAEIAGVD